MSSSINALSLGGEKIEKETKISEKFRLKDFLKNNKVVILINGTSGSGKSTLTKKLAEKYGIKNTLCSDHVRQKMRDAIPKAQDPLIHASTYETGYYLNQADLDRIEKCLKLNQSTQDAPVDSSLITQMGCVRGYEIQCEMIEPLLLKEIDELVSTNGSLIVEGVHVTESVVNKWFEKYDFCIPFMIYVKNAEEHKNRFGSRWNGSIDPALNKYVRHFDNIRAIQKSIKQIAIDSKFIKTDNDDGNKAYNIVMRVTKKYIKKLLKTESNEGSSLVISRKRNMLYHIYESIIQNIDEKKAKDTQNNKNNKLTKEDLSLWYLESKATGDVHPWFLKHGNKFFQKKTKNTTLVPKTEIVREKSASKKNKFKCFKPLDTDMYKVNQRKINKHKHQRSIADAIRKFAKQSTKSKFSESTCCTITKVNSSIKN